MIKELVKVLKEKEFKVAFAESMTGGLLSKILTDEPGASSVFELGVVSYSKNTKNKCLNIPLDFIEKYGVVSKEVAEIMAVNVKKIAKSDIGIGVTGNAGPTTQDEESMVGQVWVSIAFLDEVHNHYFYFEDMQRTLIREQAADRIFKTLMQLLKQKIIGDI